MASCCFVRLRLRQQCTDKCRNMVWAMFQQQEVLSLLKIGRVGMEGGRVGMEGARERSKRAVPEIASKPLTPWRLLICWSKQCNLMLAIAVVLLSA
jgi:hypothetical protein